MFIVCIVHIWVLGEINVLACHLRSLVIRNLEFGRVSRPFAMCVDDVAFGFENLK